MEREFETARSTVYDKVAKGARGISRVASSIGMGFLMIMMLITVADVVSRYFGLGLMGAYEIVEYTMVLTIFLCIGYTQSEKMNVAVEILFNRLSPRAQTVVEMLNAAVALVLFSLFVYAGINQTMNVYKVKSTSGVLFIPNYPFYAVEVVGYIILCLVLLGDFLMALGKLLNKIR